VKEVQNRDAAAEALKPKRGAGGAEAPERPQGQRAAEVQEVKNR
jgi:hypothetical protein